MKSIKQIVKSGAMMLALSLVFTSCEDILGEWSRPAPNPVTPAPEPTPNMLETPLTLEAAVAGAKVTFKANNNDAEKQSNTALMVARIGRQKTPAAMASRSL